MLDSFINFKVVDPRIKTSSLSYVNIYSNKLTFSYVTAEDLGYPERVRLMIDCPNKLLAVQAADFMPVRFTTPFLQPDQMEEMKTKRSRKRISFPNKAVAKVIREKMGWAGTKSTWRTYGIRYLENDIVVFDLAKAEIPKRGKAREATADEILEAYSSVSEARLQSIPKMLPPPTVSVGTVEEDEVIDISPESIIMIG